MLLSGQLGFFSLLLTNSFSCLLCLCQFVALKPVCFLSVHFYFLMFWFSFLCPFELPCFASGGGHLFYNGWVCQVPWTHLNGRYFRFLQDAHKTWIFCQLIIHVRLQIPCNLALQPCQIWAFIGTCLRHWSGTQDPTIVVHIGQVSSMTFTRLM